MPLGIGAIVRGSEADIEGKGRAVGVARGGAKECTLRRGAKVFERAEMLLSLRGAERSVVDRRKDSLKNERND